MREFTDDIDIANEHAQATLDALIKAQAKDIVPGVPGDCQLCGEFSKRLINNNCAPCRDKYKLP